MLPSLVTEGNSEPNNAALSPPSILSLSAAPSASTASSLISIPSATEEGVSNLSADPMNHDVKFYNDKQDLYNAIANFVEPALSNVRESVIIIISESQIKGVKAELCSRELEIKAMEESGRLVLLDADKTLNLFMRDNIPDSVEFNNCLGSLVRSKADQYSKILVYGEIANVLYNQGNAKGAIALEKLWDTLFSEISNAALLCGYALNNFNEMEGQSLNDVCACHAHIYPVDQAENYTFSFQKDARLEGQQHIRIHEREDKSSPSPSPMTTAFAHSKNKLIVQLQQREMVLQEQLNFLLHASHEIRTPLNATILASSLADEILPDFVLQLFTLLIKMQNKLPDSTDNDRLDLRRDFTNLIPLLAEHEQKEETKYDDLSIQELSLLVATHLLEILKCNKSISASAEQQKKIVDTALNIAKFANRNEQRSFNLFELRPFFESICTMYAPYFNGLSSPSTANKNQKIFEFAGPQAEIWVKTDETGLSQAITNLLSNAIKFTPPNGTIKLSYSCEVDATRTIVKVNVNNTGKGIPAVSLPHLFKPKYQVPSNQHVQAYGGSGLGLAISKGIVMQLGGEIKVDSQEGKETTFYFSVPCVNPTPIEIKQHKESQLQAKNTVPTYARRNILIVDDVENIRKLNAKNLEKYHNCFLANNGKEAVAQCLQRKFDIILIDIRMPVLNGITATKIIRAAGKNCTTPIVALSGDTEQLQIEEARAAGVDDYLIKPTKPKTLLSKIEEVCVKKMTSFLPVVTNTVDPKQLKLSFFALTRSISQDNDELVLRPCSRLVSC